jgi:hypothetical protein
VPRGSSHYEALAEEVRAVQKALPRRGGVPEERRMELADDVEASAGGKAEVAEGVVKVSFPRNDVKVEVDGWAMPPFMGLTSWAGFTPGQKPGVEAMVMGDLVLFEDEVSAALDAGLEVTALHNHFFYDRPKGSRASASTGRPFRRRAPSIRPRWRRRSGSRPPPKMAWPRP